jgi:hypothetical protein
MDPENQWHHRKYSIKFESGHRKIFFKMKSSRTHFQELDGKYFVLRCATIWIKWLHFGWNSSFLNISLYSIRFKIKVTFGHKLRYKIKVLFGEISLKLRQTNWNVARNNANIVAYELPSQITVYTCLTIDIWTWRRQRTSTRFYVLRCHPPKMAGFQCNWRQKLYYGHP